MVHLLSKLRCSVGFCAKVSRCEHWEVVNQFCSNLAYKCFTILPPHKKISSLGVGSFTQYAHLSSLKLEVELCALCVVCSFTHFTASKQGKLCTNFVQTWHTSGQLCPSHRLGMDGFHENAHLCCSKFELEFCTLCVV